MQRLQFPLCLIIGFITAFVRINPDATAKVIRLGFNLIEDVYELMTMDHVYAHEHGHYTPFTRSDAPTNDTDIHWIELRADDPNV